MPGSRRTIRSFPFNGRGGVGLAQPSRCVGGPPILRRRRRSQTPQTLPRQRAARYASIPTSGRSRRSLSRVEIRRDTFPQPGGLLPSRCRRESSQQRACLLRFLEAIRRKSAKWPRCLGNFRCIDLRNQAKSPIPKQRLQTMWSRSDSAVAIPVRQGRLNKAGQVGHSNSRCNKSSVRLNRNAPRRLSLVQMSVGDTKAGKRGGSRERTASPPPSQQRAEVTLRRAERATCVALFPLRLG